MKKLIRLSVPAIMLSCLLVLSACGNGSTANDKPDAQPAAPDPVDTSGSSQKVSQEESQEQPVSNEISDSGNLGDYYVEIKDGVLAEDYNGETAVIITYTWTNNSEETTSAMVNISEKAFQDGVELDSAIIMDSSVYDSGASMKDVRPGTSIDVQCAFELANQTSPVEVELSELFNFSKNGEIVGKTFTFE